jgi:hypothetical protein
MSPQENQRDARSTSQMKGVCRLAKLIDWNKNFFLRSDATEFVQTDSELFQRSRFHKKLF